MCIYDPDRNDLTYREQEHIFPAGLGGIEMLPKGYVLDQANEQGQSWSDFEQACAKFDLGRKFVSVRIKEPAPLD